MLEVFEGNEPYVFISYAHLDNLKVHKYLAKLQRRVCNIWFDVGIETGTNWNEDIAKHLINANCFIIFLTPNSMNSEYVKDEINLAVSRKKKIIPIYIEETELPLGVELLMGRIQAINLIGDVTYDCKDIVKSLPKEVFHELKIPFFIGKNNEFFLVDTSKDFPEHTYFAGESDCSFEIYYSNEKVEKEKLYSYHSQPGYDIIFRITNIIKMKYAYYNTEDNEYIIFNVLINFDAKYPVPWPDIDALVSFCIIDLENKPKIKIVDIKATGYPEEAEKFVQNTLEDLKIKE